MKIVFFMFLSLAAFLEVPATQETDLVVEATYNGYVGGNYTFVDGDDSVYEFSEIGSKAAKKYDLDTEEFVGKDFKVTYKTDTVFDENEEEYDIYVIVDLELRD